VNRTIDLLVIGAGPVGLAAAVDAARSGMRVVVTDPRTGPIDKACGEGLMPTAMAHLHRLGIDPPGRDLTGITYVTADGRHSASAPFPHQAGRGVRRTTLSLALHESAEALGVERMDRRVDGITQCDDHLQADGHVHAHTERGDIIARWVIAADGLHSPTRRALGVESGKRVQRRYGLRSHVALAPWTSNVEVHWADVGEAYVTPVNDEMVGIAILGDPGIPFTERLRSFPVLAERLAGASASAVLGAGPFRQSSTQRVCGRVLLVGDASGYVDALTGEGIAVGLAQAAAAVESLLREDPLRYEDQWASSTRSSRLLTDALLRASRSPMLRRHLVSAARRYPSLFRLGVRWAS
jgi:flavin-dependent dehydrogenase